ncbi:hypothetical protein Rhopal_000383-T1 [Rhodotorula paludigena]|uniref:BZIP domain-containing protein n=1 Tax=Rhodotorula paludigena TaxID=86838 RepID=A0AAV5GC62_9BASI|nr:hypothetical protein Rhopal_000383-T1 [Rhodotorula paludigena]
MQHSWAFEQLAPSPGTTPANGPAKDRSDLALSFPCDSNALQAQLEQWTNVAFEFDSPDFADSALAPASSSFDDVPDAKALAAPSPNDDRRYSRVGEFGFKHAQRVDDDAASTVDLSALLGSSAGPTSSIVDPALSLPGFAASGPALPSFFAPATPAAGAHEVLTPVVEDEAPSPARGGKKASAAKKKRAPTAAVAAKLATASQKLPLPEGIDTTGMTDEELNRLAIEEDKRRRNTAASARFRVKKKQREQALEQTAKELQERVAVLEKEVETLRTENGWLRGLVVDKGTETGMDGAANTRKRARVDDESILV